MRDAAPETTDPMYGITLTDLDIAARAERILECQALGMPTDDESIDMWVRMTHFGRNRPARKTARAAKSSKPRSRKAHAHPWAHDES